ncbi:glutamyl-tRNA reductase [Paludibacterium purpuratum]|uniref:Glutamyl-tRNA reductase n=1 Tax=Paludibacterium purpuratum TaxID=1144873 RepID=A0A4R7B043_9NEIS|nr:glutamyl-tRNA reductase [Paludibacterium purpuratum]TDR72453.1 glutamyl-tRNA reductase [Paludibacterium purpuratum]
MHLLAFGLNHQTAPLAIREKLAFPADILPEALRQLTQSQAAHEAAIVSTCNRTEIYCAGQNPADAIAWLAHYHNMSPAEVEPYLYRLDASDVARHAFRVASGLDSMVLGETQILGQLKDAVRVAQQSGTLGTHLNALFQQAFSVAKEVRSKTAIGASSVSMAAAGVRLAEQIFPSIRELNLLFIGAGEMIELVATHFAARQPAGITVANRTLERGRALAEQFGGQAITLADLHDHLARFDVVVTSTASPVPIVGKGLVERAIKQRRHRPMFMLDLAVPRDVEPEVASLADVFLYTVDDIASVVEVGREARQVAAEQAENIIVSRVNEFSQWLRQRQTVPLIRALRDEGERLRRHALEAALKQLARGDAPEKVLETLSVQLTNKLMHPPTQALSQHGDDQAAMSQAVARIYRLHSES